MLDDDEVPPESPSVVTPMSDVFMSLDACVDQLFVASQPSENVDKRMSISTRYLSSSGCVINLFIMPALTPFFCIAQSIYSLVKIFYN